MYSRWKEGREGKGRRNRKKIKQQELETGESMKDRTTELLKKPQINRESRTLTSPQPSVFNYHRF